MCLGRRVSALDLEDLICSAQRLHQNNIASVATVSGTESPSISRTDETLQKIIFQRLCKAETRKVGSKDRLSNRSC